MKGAMDIFTKFIPADDKVGWKHAKKLDKQYQKMRTYFEEIYGKGY